MHSWRARAHLREDFVVGGVAVEYGRQVGVVVADAEVEQHLAPLHAVVGDGRL